MTVSSTNQTEEITLQTTQLPLLSLPGVVCLPGELLAVRISSLADRCLVYDAQADNNLLAMTSDCEEWETTSASDSACLCEIVSATRMVTGEVLLLLSGMTRATLIKETATSKAYRLGNIQTATDVVSADSTLNRDERKRELWELYQLLFSEQQLDSLVCQTVNLLLPLGSLCDLLAVSMPLPFDVKTTLLAACDVDLRSLLLIQHLRELLIQKVTSNNMPLFPPAFSGN